MSECPNCDGRVRAGQHIRTCESEALRADRDRLAAEVERLKRALSFDRLREVNVRRCVDAFHAINTWSPTDWATAMAGECGEACNVVKKLRRIDSSPQIGHAPADALVVDLGKELADLVIYADLLAARMGIDLGVAVRSKFNEVSERVKSEVRL